MASNEMVMALLSLQTRFFSMIICIWCRESHEVKARFRCYNCGKTMCQEQIEELPSLITHQLGVIAHDARSCGPVYDVTNVSPVQRIMWFMQESKRRQANGL